MKREGDVYKRQHLVYTHASLYINVCFHLLLAVLQRWGGNVSAVDFFVTHNNTSKARNALEKLQLRYDVIIDNVQHAIDRENQEGQMDELVGRVGKLNHFTLILMLCV